MLQPRRHTLNVLDQSKQILNVPPSLRGVTGANGLSSTEGKDTQRTGQADSEKPEGKYMTEEAIAKMVSGVHLVSLRRSLTEGGEDGQ